MLLLKLYCPSLNLLEIAFIFSWIEFKIAAEEINCRVIYLLSTAWPLPPTGNIIFG